MFLAPESLLLSMYVSLRVESRLDPFLPLLPLLIPLGINHAREWVLPPPRNTIRRRNNARQ